MSNTITINSGYADHNVGNTVYFGMPIYMDGGIHSGEFGVDESDVEFNGGNATINFKEGQLHTLTYKKYDDDIKCAIGGEDMAAACNRGLEMLDARQKSTFRDVNTGLDNYFIRAKASDVHAVDDGRSAVTFPIVHHDEIQRGMIIVDNGDIRMDRASDKAVIGIGPADQRTRIIMDGSDSSYKDAPATTIVDMANAARLYKDDYEVDKHKEATLQVDATSVKDLGNGRSFVHFPIIHHDELQRGMIEVNNSAVNVDDKGLATISLGNNEEEYNLIMHGDNDYCARKTVTADQLIDMRSKVDEYQKAADRGKQADMNFGLDKGGYGSYNNSVPNDGYGAPGDNGGLDL